MGWYNIFQKITLKKGENNMFGIDVQEIVNTIFVIMIAIGFAYAVWNIVMASMQLMRAVEPKIRKEAITKLVLSGVGLLLLITVSFTLDTLVGLIF